MFQFAENIISQQEPENFWTDAPLILLLFMYTEFSGHSLSISNNKIF